MSREYVKQQFSVMTELSQTSKYLVNGLAKVLTIYDNFLARGFASFGFHSTENQELIRTRKEQYFSVSCRTNQISIRPDKYSG